MKDSVKSTIVVAVLIILSLLTAVVLDSVLESNEKNDYPINNASGLYQTVCEYSNEYGIPKEVIYTAMYTRSGCTPSYEEEGKIGYFAFTSDEICDIEVLLGIDITEEILKVPSNNLMLGVEYISSLYEEFGDFHTVYAALLMGKSGAEELKKNAKLYDITGSLVSLPEGHNCEEEFKKMLETEKKYIELYFSSNDSIIETETQRK